MVNITRYLADQEYEVKIDGETHTYKIVPDFSSKLRAHIFFWQDLRNPIEGITSGSNNDNVILFRRAAQSSTTT